MKAYYDLHLHSCLSPCGDKDMTPNNIVNMAAILGLDIIALTDHNSCKNCKAAIEVGKTAGITVVPGMELCTSEEIHVVCLFPDLDSSTAFDKYVNTRCMAIKNREDIYGEQLIMDSNDKIIGKEDNLLILASDISVSQVHRVVDGFGGVCYPAHIDRDSYSILSSLGGIPPECNFTAVEITAKGNVEKLKKQHPFICDIPLIKSSDAHYLENIHEPQAFLELPQCTPQSLVEILSNKNVIWGR